MECPTCADKLTTRRTFDAGRTVERDRNCEKCGDVRTIEHSLIDLEKERRDYQNRILALEREIDTVGLNYNSLRMNLRDFSKLLDDACDEN